MVCRYFGLDAEYCYDEILPDRWLAYLSVSLDMNEQDDYRAYISAGGDPKKFKWSSSDHAGMKPKSTVMEQILDGVKAGGFAARGKRDIWEYGEAIGLKTITKAEKWAEPERPGEKGKFLGHVWVDDSGNEVDTSGYIIIETEHEGAKAFSKRVRERLH